MPVHLSWFRRPRIGHCTFGLQIVINYHTVIVSACHMSLIIHTLPPVLPPVIMQLQCHLSASSNVAYESICLNEVGSLDSRAAQWWGQRDYCRYSSSAVGMGTVFTVIPWGGDKSYGNTVGLGTIMQQTAVLKLRSCSCYNYWYVYFAAYASTSV